MFVLIVDDFGINYVGKQHAAHLLAALQEHYKVTTDWMGTKFMGIDLTWDNVKQTCHLAMNGYILDILTKYDTLPHPSHSTPPINIRKSTMEPKPNSPLKTMPVHPWDQKMSNGFKALWDPSCTIVAH